MLNSRLGSNVIGSECPVETIKNFRVLTVIETLGRGGAEQALVNILPTLQLDGYQCEVAALNPPYTLADTLRAKGIVVHELGIGHRWNMIRAVSQLNKLCHKHRYHIIHAHLFFAGIYSALVTIRGLKKVVTFPNLGYSSYPANTLYKKARKGLDGFLMRHRMHGRIATSPAVAHHYQDHLKLPPIKVIPYALPCESTAPNLVFDRAAVRLLLGVPTGAFLISLCGRMVHEKGHRYFLEALADLKNRLRFPHAIFVGDGPLRSEIQSQVMRLSLEEQVKVLGARPHCEALDIMRASDVCVIPSTHEGFSLVAGEAMALEKPVIASAVGSLPYLLEDGKAGILVPSRDPTSLADAIDKVMKDPCTAHKMGRYAALRVKQRFNEKVVAQELHRFYEEIATGF